MKELRNFIKGLRNLEFEMVAVSEVCSDNESELISLDGLLDRIRELGIKEIVAEYYESLELIIGDDKYIEIVAVY
ncbi:hypothetical protein [Clostridium nigeriense]|uniref:hypothetical protein n=1 Tax=Clostridium nigeriense TaxID=1805470 RepID=UPI000833E943|nr:hypothetical protein [Clostridium nigeriense]